MRHVKNLEWKESRLELSPSTFLAENWIILACRHLWKWKRLPAALSSHSRPAQRIWLIANANVQGFGSALSWELVSRPRRILWWLCQARETSLYIPSYTAEGDRLCSHCGNINCNMLKPLQLHMLHHLQLSLLAVAYAKSTRIVLAFDSEICDQSQAEFLRFCPIKCDPARHVTSNLMGRGSWQPVCLSRSVSACLRPLQMQAAWLSSLAKLGGRVSCPCCACAFSSLTGAGKVMLAGFRKGNAGRLIHTHSSPYFSKRLRHSCLCRFGSRLHSCQFPNEYLDCWLQRCLLAE